MSGDAPVVVVGAGLAGLACAVELSLKGRPVVVLEASDAVGGRARTDVVDGFRLDRGFQVLLTAYPEAQRTLDLPALGLRAFHPGALVRLHGRFHRVVDPWRKPLSALAGLFSPVGSFGDKWLVRALRAQTRAGAPDDAWRRAETTTADALDARGFSSSMIERFFRPFFGGVFLERDLATSSRLFEYTFRMFSEGDAAVPALGMGEMARQLASRLPAGSVRLGAHVAAVSEGRVTLSNGEPVAAASVVVATEAAEAKALLRIPTRESRAVSCVYFDAETDPVGQPLLVLNGEGRGIVNHLAVMSAVAPTYAPRGRSLVSVSVLAPHVPDVEVVREELRGWYGDAVSGWRHLRTYRIAAALPVFPPPTSVATPPSPRLAPHLYVAGDHRLVPSIEGALRSGRLAAEAILTERR